jgi:hypothetical protein
MATRMQQRRGTAAQWTAANPTLAAGEIGFETDTNKFKMGNGSSAWTALTYFANSAIVTDLIGGALPATLDTLTEIVTAINQDPAFFTTIATNLSTHASDTTSVHGITDTAALATQSYVTDALDAVTGDYSALAGTGLAWNAGTEELEIDNTVATKTYADGVVGTHSTDTTSVHGIADTTALATTTDVSTAKTAAETTASGYVSTHNSATTNVHGIADTSILITTTGAQSLTNKTITSPLGLVKADVGLGNVDNTADASKPVSTATQTALDLKLASATAATTYAPLASAALTGTPTAPTATAATNTTQIATTAFVRAEVAALVNSAASTLDTLGEIATALGNDANFSATLTTNLGLKAPLASPTFTGTVTLPAAGIVFSDGTQTKVGVPSITTFGSSFAASATVAAGEQDKFVPVAGAVVITLPATGYSTGQSIDFYQASGTGASFASTNSVVGTPGLKFRTTNSVVTAMKTATGWLIFGDLSA